MGIPWEEAVRTHGIQPLDTDLDIDPRSGFQCKVHAVWHPDGLGECADAYESEAEEMEDRAADLEADADRHRDDATEQRRCADLLRAKLGVVAREASPEPLGLS